jgi:hypothetical protein
MTVGYSGLVWTRVARPGDEINLAVNPGATRLTQTAPPFAFHDSVLWAQGLELGFEMNY